MGSAKGTFDPMPPEQHMRLMTSRDPVEQAMGWMYYRTIRYRNVNGENIPTRTPYACDEFGRALGVKDLAVFYRWTPRKAERAIHKAVVQGWVRKTEGKLWLRADFPVKFAVVREEGEGEEVPHDPIADFIEGLPPYQQLEVQKLPRREQETLVENLKNFETWDKEVQADAMMAARDRTQPVRHQIWEAYGISLKVGPKLERARKTCAVQLELFGAPLLNLPPQPPQKTDAPPAPPAADPPPPPPPPPTPFDASRQAKAPMNAGTAEVYTVLTVMRRFCAADDDAAAQLLRKCREDAPSCTAVQIAEALEVKGPLAKGKDNPTGFLLIAVPKLFTGHAWQQRQREAQAEAEARDRRTREVSERALELEAEQQRYDQAVAEFAALTGAEQNALRKAKRKEIGARLQRLSADVAAQEVDRAVVLDIAAGKIQLRVEKAG